MTGRPMPRVGFVKRIWLNNFSKPACDRAVFKHVSQKRPQRILQLGIHSLERCECLLTLAHSLCDNPIHFVGLDYFEGRSNTAPQGPTLKQAHQRLHGLANTQLVPGQVDISLARLCNHIGIFDLILIDSVVIQNHLDRCWFFIQRITSQTSLILREEQNRGQTTSWKVVSASEISSLASRTVLRKAG
ncbi:MAG: hypothetical protein ABGW78_04480 [Pirellulales bacterium]